MGDKKHIHSPLEHTRPLGIFLMIICTVFIAFAQLLLKTGSSVNFLEFGKGVQLPSLFTVITHILVDPEFRLLFLIIGGFILGATGGVFMVASLRLGELSVLFPVFAVNYVWVILLAIWLLGESMNTYKWIGIIGIFVGVSLIGFGSSKQRKSLESFGVVQEV